MELLTQCEGCKKLFKTDNWYNKLCDICKSIDEIKELECAPPMLDPLSLSGKGSSLESDLENLSENDKTVKLDEIDMDDLIFSIRMDYYSFMMDYTKTADEVNLLALYNKHVMDLIKAFVKERSV